MIELTVVVFSYAAIAAFRAAEPDRFGAETGISPPWLDGDAWRRALRGTGTVLLAAAFAVGWSSAGVFEGLVVASAAVMVSCVVVILGAPIARRVVWTVAAVALGASPVLLALTLAWGGSHGG